MATTVMVAPGPSPMTATTLLVNWDAVGAIGEWFGAVATAAATGGALWFGYRGDRIRLKVTATVDLVIFSGAAPVAVVRLAAVNNGPRPATLTHAGAELDPGGGRVIIPPDHERDLPRRLDQGDHVVTEVHVLVSEPMPPDVGIGPDDGSRRSCCARVADTASPRNRSGSHPVAGEITHGNTGPRACSERCAVITRASPSVVVAPDISRGMTYWPGEP